MTWGPAMGILPADRPADPTATGLGVYLWDTGGPKPHFRAIPSGVTLQDVELKINSVPYVFYIIRRPTGGAWIICSSPDANFGTGRLLWVDDTDDLGAATYLGMDVNEGGIRFDFMRALAAGKLGAPFTTGYGPALAYDTFTRADGADLGSTEGGGYAWTKIGACSIAGGQMAPGELGGAVIEPRARCRGSLISTGLRRLRATAGWGCCCAAHPRGPGRAAYWCSFTTTMCMSTSTASIRALRCAQPAPGRPTGCGWWIAGHGCACTWTTPPRQSTSPPA